MRDRSIPITILIADDDEDDRLLACDALAESGLPHVIFCVTDGEELMDFLHRRGKYLEPGSAPRPGLILLDLSMPKKDGREALREIKSDSDLRQIPIVILTTSKSDEDISRSYDSGASSYMSKPVTFVRLVEMMKGLSHYWFDMVNLPKQEESEK